MSELKTNQIATNDGNNVAIDNSLNLKSYTTTQRDALTSVAGDMIYNSGATEYYKSQKYLYRFSYMGRKHRWQEIHYILYNGLI